MYASLLNAMAQQDIATWHVETSGSPIVSEMVKAAARVNQRFSAGQPAPEPTLNLSSWNGSAVLTISRVPEPLPEAASKSSRITLGPRFGTIRAPTGRPVDPPQCRKRSADDGESTRRCRPFSEETLSIILDEFYGPTEKTGA